MFLLNYCLYSSILRTLQAVFLDLYICIYVVYALKTVRSAHVLGITFLKKNCVVTILIAFMFMFHV